MILLTWLLISMTGAAPQADVRITNTHVVATCLNGAPVKAGERKWMLAAPVSLVLTMRNQPRPGVDNAAPGYASITFTPEAGHKYEIEVRSDAAAFSKRVWPQGAWTPVVRDRTTEQVVSSAPRWIENSCG